MHSEDVNTEAVIPAILGDPYAPSLPELTHGYLPPGSEPPGALNFDTNSWSSTAVVSFANAILSDSSIFAELQAVMDQIDQLEEHHTNNDAANPMLAFAAPGAGASSQLPSPEAPTTNFYTVPIISSKHESYMCSWHLHDSGAKCDHVAPDRPAFLRHLGEIHQVSGGPDATIVCQLLDSKMGSACRRSIKRGNFPRHVDTHYPLRYNCQYCPPGTSFSRQDSWMKHMRSKHAYTPSVP